MPSAVPSIITTTPATLVSVSSAYGMPYNAILSSIGTSIFFEVDYIYVYSSSLEQLSQNLGFTLKDANGNQRTMMIAENVDPYQAMHALFYKTDDVLILDGRTYFSVTMLPFADMYLIFYGRQLDKGQYLHHESNFDSIVEIMKVGDKFYFQSW